MMNINEELMAKARAAKSVEELLALAKENDVELTEEKANYFFRKMNQSGELEDDELDSVAGGGCFSIDVERLKSILMISAAMDTIVAVWSVSITITFIAIIK